MKTRHDSDSHSAQELAATGKPAAIGPSGARVRSLRDVEGAHVLYALEACGWNKRQAALALGISRDTLYRKIADYGLESARAEQPASPASRRAG